MNCLDRRRVLSLTAAAGGIIAAQLGNFTAAALPTKSATPKKLVLVHGRGQAGLDPEILKAQ